MIRNCGALFAMLRAEGLTFALLSGDRAGTTLADLGYDSPAMLTPSHTIEFDRRVTGRRPWLDQIAFGAELAIADQLRAVERFTPKLVITTKHWLSVPSVADHVGLPWLSYLTDGLAQLLPAVSPITARERDEHWRALDGALARARLRLVGRSIAEILSSPFGNLARGFPEITDAEVGDARPAVPTLHLGGFTEDTSISFDRSALTKPWDVFASFGTNCYDLELHRQVAKACADCGAELLLATRHFTADEIARGVRTTRVLPFVPTAIGAAGARIVVHHGGYGTMMATYLAGRPQLVVPVNVESAMQGVHAEAVQRLGVGAVLATPRDAAGIERTIAALLDDSERAHRAELLAIRLRDTEAGLVHQARSSVRHLAA